MRVWRKLVHVVSAEWLLDGEPNGGAVILLRSAVSSISLFLGYIALKHSLDPARTWTFSLSALQAEAHGSLPVWGALIAAVYASLYARFSAQWHYLAGLYNKIIETELRMSDAPSDEQRRTLAFWKASFIEDADDLHLLTKPIFVPAIADWLTDENVRTCFSEGAIEGELRLKKVQARIDKAYEQGKKGG